MGSKFTGYTMPKRKNPFGEITPLQRKTHVGFQEMATEQDKQLVHGKSGAMTGGETVASITVT